MHEFSLMSSVLATVENSARAAGALRVTVISLRIGRLTEVLPEAMTFAHQALTAGTIAEGSHLMIDYVEPRSRCLICDYEYTHDRFSRSCPKCNALACELLAGRELEIKSIEVENAD
jgi:hydrogenase nickel incorporation protein HypA/HybF